MDTVPPDWVRLNAGLAPLLYTRGLHVMSTAHPTGSAKPNKPSPDYPLFAHATRRWAKKIRGKLHYFGSWDLPDGALKKYEAEREAREAGRKPREVSTGVTVKDLVNRFLRHKGQKRDVGELLPRTFYGYKLTTDLLIEQLGKTRQVMDLDPEDFANLRTHMITKRKWGPVRVGNFIQQVRSVFKFGHEAKLLPQPVNFGPGFARPSKRTLRLEREKKGPRMFEADELRALVEGVLVVGTDGPKLVKPSVAMRAMILLGVNCGFGNADCGTLPLAALDLASGWVTYPRPKTGIKRRCHLWPETVEALKDVLRQRVEPIDPAMSGLVFITVHARSWSKNTSDNPVSKEMRKLLDALGWGGNRNFYALRHTFETIGGEAKDQIAVDHIMGHARDDMASAYRERISDARLKAVSEFVRAWVWPAEAARMA
jgi:integrase